MHVEVTPVSFEELASEEEGEKSEAIRERVVKARELQGKRFESFKGIHANAQMPANMVRKVCKIDKLSQNLIKAAMDKLGLSARAYDRILKVARTIADLSGEEKSTFEHIAEAIQFRTLDRANWAG